MMLALQLMSDRAIAHMVQPRAATAGYKRALAARRFHHGRRPDQGGRVQAEGGQSPREDRRRPGGDDGQLYLMAGRSPEAARPRTSARESRQTAGAWSGHRCGELSVVIGRLKAMMIMA